MNVLRRLQVSCLGLLLIIVGACAMADSQRAVLVLKRMQAERYFTGSPQVALVTAAGKGDVQAAQRELDQGADVNAVGRDGMTPLFWTIGKQNLTGLRFLLAHGADPNTVTNWHDDKGTAQMASALHLAAILDNPDYLRALLEADGNPNLVEDAARTNYTPIYKAILHQRRANVDALLQHGADINHRNLSKETPIHYAVNTRHYVLALHLLRRGADATIENRWGYSAVGTVKQFGNSGVVRDSEDDNAYHEFVAELKRRGLW